MLTDNQTTGIDDYAVNSSQLSVDDNTYSEISSSGFDYGYGNLICQITHIVNKVSQSKVINGHYFFRGEDVTDDLIRKINLVTSKLNPMTYGDVFRCDVAKQIAIPGSNGKVFLFDGLTFNKSSESHDCNYIRHNSTALPLPELRPYVDVFVKALQQYIFMDLLRYFEGTQVLGCIQACITHFQSDKDFTLKGVTQPSDSKLDRDNLILKLIKDETSSADFNSYLRDSNKGSEKNFDSLKIFINDLFDNRARLMVVRLDLYYETHNRVSVSELQAHLESEQAIADRERFFYKWKRNPLFEFLVGYVCKVEHGLDKGFHFHTLLIFDGSKVCKDVSLARLVGEYWRDVITEGRGNYNNCNAKKEKYKKLGIGMINYSDKKLRENLLKWVTAYLIKPDLFSQIILRGKSGTGNRSLTKSLLPIKEKLGRPREKEEVSCLKICA